MSGIGEASLPLRQQEVGNEPLRQDSAGTGSRRRNVRVGTRNRISYFRGGQSVRIIDDNAKFNDNALYDNALSAYEWCGDWVAVPTALASTTAAGRLLVDVVGAAASFESRRIGERAKGRPCGEALTGQTSRAGTPPTGCNPIADCP
jgi:hypothetical protein